MIGKSTLTFALLAFTLAFTGCDKSKKEEPQKPVAAKKEKEKKPKDKDASKKKKSPGMRLAALSPDLPRTKMGDIPTAPELELEAAKAIAIENLEAELDRLEAEIASDSE